MKIHFGMNLDGARWTHKNAALRECSCGPLGMLKLLETRLGLGGCEISQASRIAAYLGKVRAVYAATPEAWGAESFLKDDWSMAKRLLALRDELVEAGWDFVSGDSDRLRLLSRIEKTGLPTPRGSADRLKAVAERCSSETFSDVELEITGRVDDFPMYWNRILECGKLKCTEKPTSSALQSGVKVDYIEAANEFELSGIFARVLQEETKVENKSVAVIVESDTTLLDGFLRRVGLPILGESSRSAEREVLQILPLWIENMWYPFSAQTVLSILKSSVSPFPRKICGSLSRAVSNEPGCGGEMWNEAWRKLAEGENALAPEMLETYRKVLEAERYELEENGIPREEFVRRLSWLNQRLAGYMGEKSKLEPSVKQVLQITLAHIKSLKELVSRFEKLTRPQVRRLLESLAADGGKMPYAVRQVSPWTVCKAPDQVPEGTDVVLWWDFSASERTSGTYWSTVERETLNCGEELDPIRASECEAEGWRRAVNNAKAVRLFHPLVKDGKDCPRHPFVADLQKAKLLPDDSELCPIEDIAEERNPPLAAEEASSPIARIVADKDLSPKSVSATQLKTLLDCPFQWYLTKHAGLEKSDALSLQTGSTMIGLLAHKAVEWLINKDRETDPVRAGETAARYFDELVPQKAAELLAPDREVERAHYRRALQSSVQTLWEEIRKRKLSFVEAEHDVTREKAFEGLDFKGSADIVLKGEDGKFFVVDLKWSHGTHFIDAADNGRSVQLAAYAWALEPVGLEVESAYYMFPRKLFHPSEGQDHRVTWENVLEDYRRTLGEMRDGVLHKGYETSETKLGLEPGCNFCPVKVLCGKERKEKERK